MGAVVMASMAILMSGAWQSTCWAAVRGNVAIPDDEGITSQDQDYSNQSGQAMKDTSTPQGQVPMQVVPTSGLMGATVRTSNGDEFGKVKDIVLTPDEKAVSYVVIARGGFAGIGERLFAVPWSAISASSDGKRVTTSISPSELNSETSFDKDKWPDVGQTKWTMEPYSYDSMQTFTPDDSLFSLRRVSNITQLHAGNRQGRLLGTMDGLGIEKSSGRVAYGVLSVSGGLIERKKVALVPWDAVTLQQDPAVAGINIDRGKLEAAAFDKSQWPNWSDRAYSMNLYRMYGMEPGEQQQVYGYAATEGRRSSDMSREFRFDKSRVQSVRGKVLSVIGLESPTNTGDLTVVMQAEDGSVLSVYGGPSAYASRMGTVLRPGDTIVARGSRTTVGARQILVASQIDSAGHVLKLRDESGKPLWTTEDKESKFPAPAGSKTEPSERDYPGADFGG